jgi:hypothetical protein
VVFRWNGLPVFDDLNDHSVTRRAFKRALVVIRLVGPEETLDIGMSGASTPSALRFLTHGCGQEDAAVLGAVPSTYA